jgi:hypothetical protein
VGIPITRSTKRSVLFSFDAILFSNIYSNVKDVEVVRSERRKMERFSLKLPATLTLHSGERKQRYLELMTSNICSGGAFFTIEKPLSVGTQVKIDIILILNKFKNGNFKRSLINVSGSVIRTEKKGMAICFDKKYRLSPY